MVLIGIYIFLLVFSVLERVLLLFIWGIFLSMWVLIIFDWFGIFFLWILILILVLMLIKFDWSLLIWFGALYISIVSWYYRIDLAAVHLSSFVSIEVYRFWLAYLAFWINSNSNSNFDGIRLEFDWNLLLIKFISIDFDSIHLKYHNILIVTFFSRKFLLHFIGYSALSTGIFWN